MKLRVFAFHVQCLCLDSGKFGLHPFEGLAIQVDIKEDNQVYFDGQCVGNRQGAVQEFRKRVEAMKPEIEFEN